LEIADMKSVFVVGRFVEIEIELDIAVVEFVVDVAEIESEIEVVEFEHLFNGFEPNLLDLNYLLFDIVEIFVLAYEFAAW
jgi:hypothetical protein